MPHRRARGAGRGHGHEGHGRHRPRQHVRGGGLPRRGPGQGRQAHPGLRGLRGPGQPPRQDGRRHPGGLQPHDCAGLGRRGLPQPGEARVAGLHGRLLPPAAHRQGGPGRAQPRAHRAVGLPGGGDRDPDPRRVRSGGPAHRGPARRDLRPRALLPGAHGPRDRGPAAREPGPAAPARQDRPARGGHQRRPLPAQGGPPGPRRAALHRLGQEGPRRRPPALRHRGVLPEEPRADGRGLSRPQGRPGQHREDRRDVLVPAQGRELAARLHGPPGLHHHELLREGDPRRLRRAAQGPRAPGRRGPAPPPALRLRGAARQ